MIFFFFLVSQHIACSLCLVGRWLDLISNQSENSLFFPVFLCFLDVAQDDWENSWSNSGAGGKAPMSRQTKGAYREHPYGRYWPATGRELLRQLSQIVTLNFSKVISLSFAPFFYGFILFFKLDSDVLLDVSGCQMREMNTIFHCSCLFSSNV